ncbi:hypothetical protein [Streptomyces sp. NPDC097981]|uniref:hypothetical protein n=1 Tax=Streptomyces sp. NPDC097981 TaxID=3155428 RepID=UPI00332180D8
MRTACCTWAPSTWRTPTPAGCSSVPRGALCRWSTTARGRSRHPLPSRTDVHAAIDSLTSETGRRPSVLALATRLGLANTTFRRNYPDICDELAAIARTPSGTTAADAYSTVQANNARLRRDNRDLAEQLELAIVAERKVLGCNQQSLMLAH